jgi:chromosome condensin MukBEF ATPase and DNA-binding subunit MukB
MMENLLARGETLATEAQVKATRRTAQRMQAILRGARITLEDMQVMISGRGIIKYWLSAPEVRFLAELLK